MKAKAKQAKPKRQAVKRQAVRTAKPIGSGLELLKMANKVDLQRYAAEGGPLNRKSRIWNSFEKIIGGAGPLEDIFAIRFASDRGMITGDQAFAFIHLAAEKQARADSEFERLSRAIDMKRSAAGLAEDDDWPGDEIPKDVEKLYKEFADRFLQLKIAILRHHEEYEMADLLLNDPDAYQARVTKGWKSIKEKK